MIRDNLISYYVFFVNSLEYISEIGDYRVISWLLVDLDTWFGLIEFKWNGSDLGKCLFGYRINRGWWIKKLMKLKIWGKFFDIYMECCFWVVDF